jgi:colanic acid/amylovoran biosynthesis glycosyltransferase
MLTSQRLSDLPVQTGLSGSHKIAYLMSRFPTIAETFILYEILEIQRLGLQIEIFPLLRQREKVIHAEAAALVERAHYSYIFSLAVLAAQIYWLYRRPRAYLNAWWKAIRGNLASPKFLSRALIVVPQSAWFARQMQALGVEHIHAHWATHTTLAAYIIQQLTDLPYSFTAHSHDIYFERPMLEEKIRRASFVVTISEYGRRLLGQLYGAAAEEKMVVIHCGVDLTVFQPRPARQRQEPFVIGCVASLRAIKGHLYLIEACAHLKAQNVPFRCLLIGEGDYRPHIEAAIARYGLQAQVTLLGHQPRHRVRELLTETDVLVLPSLTEGIPVALMEAMATELPVVATDITGIPELVEHEQTGLLVPARDSTTLAIALLRLWADPELGKKLGRAGRQKVWREFNLQSNAAKLHRLLAHNWKVEPRPAEPFMLASVSPVEN